MAFLQKALDIVGTYSMPLDKQRHTRVGIQMAKDHVMFSGERMTDDKYVLKSEIVDALEKRKLSQFDKLCLKVPCQVVSVFFLVFAL